MHQPGPTTPKKVSKKRSPIFPSSAASSESRQSKCVPAAPSRAAAVAPRPHSYLIFAYQNIVPAPRPELIEDDGGGRSRAGGDGGRLISRSQYTAQEEKKGGIKRGEKESESIITDLTDGRIDGRTRRGRTTECTSMRDIIALESPLSLK